MKTPFTTIRKRFFAFAAATLLMGSVAFAGGTEDGQQAANNLRNAIVERLDFPYEMKPELRGQEITLTFKIDEKGKLNVLQAVGAPPQLNNYVAGSLQGTDLSEFEALAGRKLKLSISFAESI